MEVFLYSTETLLKLSSKNGLYVIKEEPIYLFNRMALNGYLGSVVKPGGYSISAINDRRLIEDNSDVIILKNNTISMFRSIPSLI